MADAPEKIWVVEGLCEILSFNTYDNGGPSYTRTDVALAMVAAEREACAKIADKHAVEAQKAKEMGRQDSPTDMVGTASWGRASALIASAIRARTEADAQAALERIKREARNEALREAAECCTAELRNTAKLLSNPPQSSAAWDARNAILAQMEDTDDE